MYTKSCFHVLLLMVECNCIITQSVTLTEEVFTDTGNFSYIYTMHIYCTGFFLGGERDNSWIISVLDLI